MKVMNLKFYGGIAPTARDYVQNGLIHQWDGIENSAYGVHDSTITHWTDLIGGHEFVITSAYDDAVSFARITNAEKNGTNTTYNVDSDFTLHTCVTAPTSITWMAQALLGLGRDSFNKNGFVLGCLAGYSNLQAFWSSGYSGITRYLVDTGKGANAKFDLDFVFDYSALQFTVYVNGASVGYQSIDAEAWNLDGVSVYLGMGSNSGALDDASGFRQHGILLYSRALTADEIAANYAVDKERFGLT